MTLCFPFLLWPTMFETLSKLFFPWLWGWLLSVEALVYTASDFLHLFLWNYLICCGVRLSLVQENRLGSWCSLTISQQNQLFCSHNAKYTRFLKCQFNILRSHAFHWHTTCEKVHIHLTEAWWKDPQAYQPLPNRSISNQYT